MTEKQTEFDKPGYREINEARAEWLSNVVQTIPFRSELVSALDLGCGAGYFSKLLLDAGFSVTGMDLREENIHVCRERYPDISFGTINLDSDLGEIEKHDLVLMFGILYHLQSPLKTILRIANTIGRVGIVSTRVTSGNKMASYYYSELQGTAHNTARVTSVPTFSAYVSMFWHAGFDYIYLPHKQPRHIQWNPLFGNGRRYSFVVAREPMELPGWKRISPKKFVAKWQQIRLADRISSPIAKVLRRLQ